MCLLCSNLSEKLRQFIFIVIANNLGMKGLILTYAETAEAVLFFISRCPAKCQCYGSSESINSEQYHEDCSEDTRFIRHRVQYADLL